MKYEDAEKIADSIIERFTKAEVDAVYLFVNEFKSVMAPNLSVDARCCRSKFPKSAEHGRLYLRTEAGGAAGQPAAALHEGADLPGAAGIGGGGARRAHDRDGRGHVQRVDMIDKLTLYMNRVRQASITREIIEIVSGAAALG